MKALIIIGIILAVFVLLCLIRVGCRVIYSEDGFFLHLKIAGLQLRILPTKTLTRSKEIKKQEKAKRKKEKKEEKKKQKKQKQQKGNAPPKQETKKKSPGDYLWLTSFLKPVFQTLNKLRKKLKIERFEVKYIIGGADDPANAAMQCGIISAGGGTLLPFVYEVFDIRSADISIDVNFQTNKAMIYVDASATYRIGQLLGIIIALGIKALKLYLKHTKESSTTINKGGKKK